MRCPKCLEDGVAVEMVETTPNGGVVTCKVCEQQIATFNYNI